VFLSPRPNPGSSLTGTLTVNAVPFAATRPDQVVPLLRLDTSFIAGYASRRAWAASIRTDVLPTVGDIATVNTSSGGSGGGSGSRRVVAAEGGRASSDGSSSSTASSGSRPAEAADVFRRLRFCPTGVQQQAVAEWATEPPPNPFGSGNSGAAAAAGSQPQLVLGSSGTPAAERAAAASDGGSPGGQGSGSPGSQACADLLLSLPPGVSEAECEAARRLLQCSESLLLLTDLKDARMAAANVTASLLPAPLSGGSGDSGGDGGSSGSAASSPSSSEVSAGNSSGSSSAQGFAVGLSSDAVALFVAVEAEQQVGRFNASALLLLPWEPQTVQFLPIEEPGAGAEMPGSSRAAAQPAAEAGQPAAEARQAAVEAAPPGPAAEAGGISAGSSSSGGSEQAPVVRTYWLQQELAALGEMPKAAAEGGAEAAASRGARSCAAPAWAAAALGSLLCLLL